MTVDDDVITFSYDYTPVLHCRQCMKALIDDSNGNAPLIFTTSQLMDAVSEHVCDG